MGPIWGLQDPDGPHVGPMKLAIWVLAHLDCNKCKFWTLKGPNLSIIVLEDVLAQYVSLIQWLVAWPALSHYLNQCWNIVNWTPVHEIQWNLNPNSNIFIQENAFENVVWKMAAILSRHQWVKGWGITCEIALRWTSLDLTDGKLTLVRVMAWCQQATSHYLSQCWLRSMSPYGITRPQGVNSLAREMW